MHCGSGKSSLRRMAACVVLLAAGAGTGSCFAGSLAISLIDSSGASIAGAIVLLQSESDSSRRYLGRTSGVGTCQFLNLPEDTYRLDTITSLFRDRSIRALHISAVEERVLAPLTLEVGFFAGCVTRSLDLQDGILLAANSDTGDLAGAFVNRKDKPIPSVTIKLSCEEDQICGETRTNAKGEFLFRGLKPGHYSVIAKGSRHYPLTKEGFEVRAGLRLIYGPVQLESCRWGDCNPAHRHRDPKFLGPVCED